MAQLGNTLGKIADGEGRHLQARRARRHRHAGSGSRGGRSSASPSKVGAPLDITGKQIEFSYRFESSRMLGPHNRVCLTTPNSKFEHLAVPLIGEHQAINCGLALSIIDKLKTPRLRHQRHARRWKVWPRLTIPGRMEHDQPRRRA